MFETPYSMTEQLLEKEKFHKNKQTFEPACGNMAIMKVLHKNNYKGYGKKGFWISFASC